jgi:GWxTD domain-containing protein
MNALRIIPPIRLLATGLMARRHRALGERPGAFGRSFPPGFLLAFLVVALYSPSLLVSQGKSKGETAAKNEQGKDYFEKWLKQDVVYIIADEEKKVFEDLTTLEEKENFIEQFWRRRDPDPRTPGNEFKEEHYRRIAYANQHYRSAQAGWKTDRGRIYIIHGAPDEIDAAPSGGPYQRRPNEGGGITGTFPWERWRYRHIEGLGNDIELEFVDPTFTDEYRLALSPDEKDAFLHVPGGATFAELIGAAEKKDRPAFNPANRSTYPYYSEYQRARDNPFAKYETLAKVQQPTPIKYQDLKELVKVNVSYTSLPFQVREDCFALSENQVLVPVTLQIKNQDLTFKEEGGNRVARVAVYGIVSTIANQVVTEFEDDFFISYKPLLLEQGLRKSSLYQKNLVLERMSRYKLDLVVKDLNGTNLGVVRTGIFPPPHQPGKLAASSLIVAEYIQFLKQVPEGNPMFVLGDVKVRPSVDRQFQPDRPLGIYFHIYNLQLDQATLRPSLRILYRIVRDGRTAREFLDEAGESVQYSSQDRAVLINRLDLQGLAPGSYGLEVEVEDRIGRAKIAVNGGFSVSAPAPNTALRN